MPPLRHWWVLASLGAGIALGAWIEHAGGATAHTASSALEAVGTLWLNALRMTVGPLVFAMLVSAVASVADAMATGRLATRAIGWFAGLLLLAGVLAVALSQALLAAWPVDRVTARCVPGRRRQRRVAGDAGTGLGPVDAADAAPQHHRGSG